MSRVHDMGGRFGDGPVLPEPQGIPRLQENWQARALALTLASGAFGKWNIDTSRHARESLAPMDYARFSYFEKWIAGLADLLVHTDVLSLKELAGDASTGRHPLAEKTLHADSVASVLAQGSPYTRQTTEVTAYAPGQTVHTRRPAANRLVDGGHTRLPDYAAGAKGRILRCHGNHVFPDSNAHGLGEAPQPLYAVVFPAAALWSAPEHPKDEVILDLWHSYLEPV